METCGDADCCSGWNWSRTQRQRSRPGRRRRQLTMKCLENGLILQQASYAENANVWRIAPPMTATYEELDRGVAILDRSMTELGL